MEDYLKSTDVIDWKHPEVLKLARELSEGTTADIAQRCFEWVRDNIRHSWDYQLNPVTCSASEVLQSGTGFCYAKSHLLAALLRANGIPAALCYQRVSLGDGRFSLHGLNAVHLPESGWYRIDARGNKPGVDAQFVPPVEKIAFTLTEEGEFDLPAIYTDPLPEVVAALRAYQTIEQLEQHLPDVHPEAN